MNRFELLLRKWNVSVAAVQLQDGLRSEMHAIPGVCGRIAYHKGLHPFERNETIAVQLGHLELGHPYLSYADQRGRAKRTWFDQQAQLWGCYYLMPDRVVKDICRGDWRPEMLAEACDVTLGFVALRLLKLQEPGSHLVNQGLLGIMPSTT